MGHNRVIKKGGSVEAGSEAKSSRFITNTAISIQSTRAEMNTGGPGHNKETLDEG